MYLVYVINLNIFTIKTDKHALMRKKAVNRMNLIIKHLDLNWLQVIFVDNSSLSCTSENREDDPSSLSAPYCQCIYDATSFNNRLMRIPLNNTYLL